MEEKIEHTCKYCSKKFSRNSNLKRHIFSIHCPSGKTENREKFICHLCSKMYGYKKTLERHIKVCRSDKQPTPKCISCCLCNITETLKSDMLQHYSTNHDIDISTTKLKFATFSDFEKWKDQIERNTISRYVKVTIKRKKNILLQIFRCHRDGYYKSVGKNIRHIKRLGSNKINGHCPSKMYTTISFETGEVFVDFLPTHVGHSMDLGRIPLKKSDRDYIASQISQKIPFDEILNNIRNNIDENNFDRLHLLTKHDLFNIEQAYKLSNESVRRTNNYKNLDSWISQTGDSNTQSVVRYYKKQGELHGECNYELELNDYLLIIMNDGQLDFLKKYGNECIYVESKPYDFELTTLTVLDDLREGFPCMFAFSNRSDIEIYKIMFNILKNLLNEEIISPKVFISDLSDEFYVAWCEEMGPVDLRLYCNWDVNRDWKKNVLANVKGAEKQKILFKILRNLLEEPDIDVFETLLEYSLNDFENDPDFNSFGIYFQHKYIENREAWANCYRQHIGLNTNLNIERMHCNLKNIYLKAGSAGSLDKAINFIMKTARNKLHERLIILHKGKITTKLKNLRRKHKLATTWNTTDEISILTNEDGTWTISLCQGTESYLIETLNLDCNCDLSCTDCNACIHAYTCTCLDSSIKWNMCKHIHFLCIHLKTIDLPDSVQVISDEEECPQYDENVVEEVFIEENPEKITENTEIVFSVSDINRCQEITVIDDNHRKIRENAIINQLSQTVYTLSDVDQRKANIHEEFLSYLNAATTIEHCKVLENALISVGPAFAAIHSVSTPIENFEVEALDSEETIQLERVHLPCPGLVYFKKD